MGLAGRCTIRIGKHHAEPRAPEKWFLTPFPPNRITTSGYSYDAAGNLTGDGTNTYQWDAEAHLTKVINGQSVAISTNTYNALGQRVRDQGDGVYNPSTTDEAYGAGGNLLWRYTGNSSTDRSFVPFNGGILAEYWSGGTLFDHPDEIGSTTISSDYTGNNLAERLFYPYGEAWTGIDLNNFNMHQTFAQLPDYDSETDQYNTLNRHYSPSGRWMSPDPGGMKVIHLDAPQTWNLYAYVANNPTTLADPSGLDAPPPPGSSANMDSTIDPDCMLKDAERILATLNADGEEQAALVAYLTSQQSGGAQEEAENDPFTLNLGGITVNGHFSGVELSNGQKGDEIDATPQGCPDCRWAQTTARTGGSAHSEKTDTDAPPGSTPLYPADAITAPSAFYDRPSSAKAGTFTAVTTLGVADEKSKTFKVKGSMTWGYKIDENGKLSPVAPKVATPAQQERSLAALRRENHTWTIGP